MADRNRMIALVLILVTLACYWPVGRFGYTNFDDTLYLTENGTVQQGITAESLKYAVTTVDGNCWSPITWLSYVVTAQIFGPTISEHTVMSTLFHADSNLPAAHHMINLLLHVVDVVLLWWVLQRLTGLAWPSAWVAAMFAVHPAHVESVAWIAERKDGLSTLFMLLTMLAYVRYIERPGAWRYVVVGLAHAFALMSKPMAVTMPAVLFLLDFWPLRRIEIGPRFWQSVRRPFLEKIPLFLLSVGSSVITLIGTHSNHGLSQTWSLTYRLEMSIIAYTRYLGLLAWPTKLAALYPQPPSWPMAWVVGSSVLFVVLTIVSFAMARRRPFVLVGWLWFAGTLVPVIGLVVTGDASLADRYTYVPSIGVFIATAWLVLPLVAKFREVVIGAAVASVLACAALTYRQVWVWQDSVSLMGHAMEVTDNNWVAIVNYACGLSDAFREKEAGPYFKKAVEINPMGFYPNLNYGRFLLDYKKVDEAIPYIALAGKVKASDYYYLLQVGRIIDIQGNHQDAIKIFNYVIRHKPFSFDAEMALAGSYVALGQIDQAEPHFRRASVLEPYQSLPYHRLGLIAAAHNDAQAAVDYFRKALDREPTLGIAHLDYGITLARLGQFQAAQAELELAVPNLAENELQEKSKAEETIGLLMEKSNRPIDAAQHFVKAIDFARQAVAQTPNDPARRYNLAITLKKYGNRDEAQSAAKEAMDVAAATNTIFYIQALKQQFPDLPMPATRPATQSSIQKAPSDLKSWGITDQNPK